MRANGRDVLQWAVATFGPIAAQLNERGMRFVEEAVEVAQAAGVNKAQALAIINRVYDRPAGDVRKEIPQAGLTLLCLSQAASVDLEDAVAAEFERIQSIPAVHWKRRHEEKAQQGIIAPTAPDEASRCVHCGMPARPLETCRYSAAGHQTLKLPAGTTCGDCAFFKRCAALIQATPQRDHCDWFPIRFRGPNA